RTDDRRDRTGPRPGRGPARAGKCASGRPPHRVRAPEALGGPTRTKFRKVTRESSETKEAQVRSVNRREVMSGIALGAMALSGAGGKAMATTAGGSADAGVVQSGVAPGKHPIQPLPFDPAKLKGLSERLVRSHHENNYGGAVKNLNKVEEELARLNKDTPGFLVGGLKESELNFNNSMVLHIANFEP